MQLTELQGALTQQFSVLQQQALELREEKRANQNLIEKLNDRQKRATDLAAENARLSMLLEEAQNRSREFQQLGKEISGKLDQKEQRVLELEKQIEQRTAEGNAKLKDLLAEAARERVNSGHFERMQEQLELAQKRVLELQTEKSAQEKTIHENSQTIRSLREELADINGQFDNLKVQANSKVTELKTQIHQMRLRFETQSAEYQRRIKTLEIHSAESRENLSELEGRLQEKQDEIQRLKKINRAMNEKFLSEAEETINSVLDLNSSDQAIYSSPAPTQDQ